MRTQQFFSKLAYTANGWQRDVLIDVVDGVIASITADTEQPVNAELINSPLLPAMPNLHSHAFQYAMAGLGEVNLNPNDSFWSWRKAMYQLVERLSVDDVKAIAKQLYIDMLKAGYTHVGEFHYFHSATPNDDSGFNAAMSEALLEAANEVGIGITLLPALYQYSGFGRLAPNDAQQRFYHSRDQYVKLIAHLDKVVTDKPLQQVGLCFHSLRAVDVTDIPVALSKLPSDRPIHVHIAEQVPEIEQSVAATGKRPVELLLDTNGLDERWCLVHATHLTDDESDRVAASGAVVGICATTEANLGDGIFDAPRYLSNKGRWGIGSDSHITVSVNQDLRLFEYGQRLRDLQRNRIYTQNSPSIGQTLFDQALAGGNQALAIDVGIKVGGRADFVALDKSQTFINMNSPESLLDRWIFASQNDAVKDVWVAGTQVISDGKHADQNAISEAFNRVTG